jgi:hypothetical protein
MPKKMLIILASLAWTLPFFSLFVKLFYAQEIFTGCAEVSGGLLSEAVTDIFTYFTIVLTMSGIYFIILKEAHQQAKRITTLENVGSSQSKVTKSATKANKCVIIILGTFSLLYFPFALMNVLMICIDAMPVFFNILQRIGMQCMLLNSAINIFIYAAWFKDFRKAYNMMLRCGRKDNVQAFSRQTLG